ncbi:MAG TPA: FHA domain-containing protein [Bdellovibrionota bacterium]|nr:FHA domain-containing protein [Bdellovibrionota bacterium]
MYKLTIIAGPNRGSSFAIHEGENSIGRQAGSAVVLQSSKVSKRHCVLVVENSEIIIKDQGSSNGTFVNGILTRMKALKPGDKISVGEYVLEVDNPLARAPQFPPAVANFANVVRFPVEKDNSASPQSDPLKETGNLPNLNSLNDPNVMPKDLKGKALWYFENRVMPFFYGLNLKHEWKLLCVALFAAFALANLMISVTPLVDSARQGIVKESARRARFMAKQIADFNAPHVASGAETKADIGLAEYAEGVRLAVLIDMDNRIIAPGKKFNQYLMSGPEAIFAVRARDAFRAGRETGMTTEIDDSTITAIEPLLVLNPSMGKNVIRGMAIVSIDTSLSTPEAGEIGVVYSETLILTGILGAIILMIMYKLTLRPFQVLSDDMDKVLKGELPQVTHEFKFEETAPLWDLINATLQRVPRGTNTFEKNAESGPTIEDYITPIRTVGELGRLGMVLCDSERKIAYMNSVFEEISGIRVDGAIGQTFPLVVREEALGAFTTDLLDRVTANPAGDPIVEDYEFSGLFYKVHASAVITRAGQLKGYLLLVVRADSNG